LTSTMGLGRMLGPITVIRSTRVVVVRETMRTSSGGSSP
jgi:hypothetical protein